MKSVGKRIREIRKRSHQTQKDFGDVLGIDRGHVSNIERGKANPSSSLVKLICGEYNVSEHWLLTGEGGWTESPPQKIISTIILDRDLLTEIIIAIEECLSEKKISIPVTVKADFIILMYEYYESLDKTMRGSPDSKKENIINYLNFMTKTMKINDTAANDIFEDIGGGNIPQKGVEITIKTKIGKWRYYMSPPETIESDFFLYQSISGLLRDFNDRMYEDLKKDFGIKNASWMNVWTWPKECVPELASYLVGKNEKAVDQIRLLCEEIGREWQQKAPIPPQSSLYAEEKELLSYLGLEMNDPGIKRLLFVQHGVKSHRHLTLLQHWQFVRYLEGQVEKVKQIEELKK